ncbi:MAG TPA: class I SAM-dependent methyltransferase [Acidimicrobiales bacterium]
MPTNVTSSRDSSESVNRGSHWDAVYVASEPESRSWYQKDFSTSLELFEALEVSESSAVIDVGGGESRLVDHLIAKNFSDVTVLDISDVSLKASVQRVGPESGVTWITHDLLTWQPERRYDAWHDRAVFHFLAPSDVVLYRELLLKSLTPKGAVVLGTFALDGPEYCSGLAVSRYGCEEITAFLGDQFEVSECRKEPHTTPSGSIQAFTWIGAKRKH